MTSPFAFLPNIGPLEVAIVLLILIVIFGPKRIPAAFRSIGDALRGFRDTIGGKEPAALADSSKEDGDPPASGDRGSETAGQSGGRSEAKTDV